MLRWEYLDVPVQYFKLVQLLEPLDHLYEDVPDVGLAEGLADGLSLIHI